MPKNSLKNAAKSAAPTPTPEQAAEYKRAFHTPEQPDPERPEPFALPPTPRTFRETATVVRKALAAAVRDPAHALANVRCEVRRSRLPSEPGTPSRLALFIATSVEPTPKVVKAIDLILESFGAPRGGPVTRFSPSPEIGKSETSEDE